MNNVQVIPMILSIVYLWVAMIPVYFIFKKINRIILENKMLNDEIEFLEKSFLKELRRNQELRSRLDYLNAHEAYDESDKED